jgi:hypothetical protein
MTELETDTTSDVGHQRDRSGYGWIIAIELALVVLVGLGVAALSRGASAADPDHALHSPSTVTVASAVTVALDALPPETADMYRYAAGHAEQFSEIPCYCGCDRSLGHRNLEDCFVTTDGRWDAHASGCAVCTIEASSAQELIDTGTATTTVRQRIIDRYGPPPTAQPGATP